MAQPVEAMPVGLFEREQHVLASQRAPVRRKIEVAHMGQAVAAQIAVMRPLEAGPGAVFDTAARHMARRIAQPVGMARIMAQPRARPGIEHQRRMRRRGAPGAPPFRAETARRTRN